MDINLRVPAIEKLLDFAASGIGSVAGPMLASWRARQEAKAKAIAAHGEAEAQRIITEGQATTMGIIASAQADARSILVSPDSNVKGQLEFGAAVTQRIQFQEEKRQSNIGQIVTQAALELEGKEVEDNEPDHDWTARFFNDIQDVSTQETQFLYAKILAGEVERPGSTSIRTLSILRDLDRSTAALFRTLCSACISLRLAENNILDARVPSLGGNAGANALQKYGLGFDQLNALNEHGLIIADYNSSYDYKMSVGVPLSGSEPNYLRIPFWFQGRRWVLEPTTQHLDTNELRVIGVALTRSGRELSRIVELEPMEAYVQDLTEFFSKQGLRMVESSLQEPHSFSPG